MEVSMEPPIIKFLESDDDVGISPVGKDLLEPIWKKLGEYTHRPKRRFPVSLPVSLDAYNVDRLNSVDYVVTYKPSDSRRYLLYIDSECKIYLEDQRGYVFYVQASRAIKLPSLDVEGFIRDTVLDGHFNRSSAENEQQIDNNLVFCIQDAIRCNGFDLTNRGISERIDFIRVYL